MAKRLRESLLRRIRHWWGAIRALHQLRHVADEHNAHLDASPEHDCPICSADQRTMMWEDCT